MSGEMIAIRGGEILERLARVAVRPSVLRRLPLAALAAGAFVVAEAQTPTSTRDVQPDHRHGWVLPSVMTGTPSVRHTARWKTRSSTACPSPAGRCKPLTPAHCLISGDGTAATDMGGSLCRIAVPGLRWGLSQSDDCRSHRKPDPEIRPRRGRVGTAAKQRLVRGPTLWPSNRNTACRESGRARCLGGDAQLRPEPYRHVRRRGGDDGRRPITSPILPWDQVGTTITYMQEVVCQTESDQGSPLMVSFAGLGTVVSRSTCCRPEGPFTRRPTWIGALRWRPAGPARLAPAGEAGWLRDKRPWGKPECGGQDGHPVCHLLFGAYANPSSTQPAHVTFTATRRGRYWPASTGPCCPEDDAMSGLPSPLAIARSHLHGADPQPGDQFRSRSRILLFASWTLSRYLREANNRLLRLSGAGRGTPRPRRGYHFSDARPRTVPRRKLKVSPARGMGRTDWRKA